MISVHSAPVLVIEHRAGNDLRRLRTAEPSVVEADVHLFRGRLEVRHLKTIGPLGVYWDRWQLPLRFRPRVVLADVLDAASPSRTLILDLKGRSGRLARMVLETLGGRAAIVCSRHWSHLDAFHGLDHVRVVHSVGSRRQLRALRRLRGDGRLAGVSIHQRLLDETTAAGLVGQAELVMSWPVNTLARARELLSWGVRGLITDDPAVLEQLAAA